ncbi:MAG: hypothetical protein R3C03_17475 [Pirellulaceae bacterium]
MRLVKRVIWFLLFCILFLGITLAIVAILGMKLRVEHSATAQRAIDGNLQDVWAAVVQLQQEFEIPVTVTEERPPIHRVTQIVEEPGAAFGGTWTVDLAVADSQTLVTIREDGKIYNPVFRLLGKHVFGHEATMNQFLDQLETKFSAESSPQ